MKIEFKLISLEHQEIVRQFDAFIELLHNRIFYKVKFKAFEPKDKQDLALGTEMVNTLWERVADITCVVGIEIEFIPKTEQNKNQFNRWIVCINMQGYSGDIKIYFEKEAEARAMHDQLLKWRFGD